MPVARWFNVVKTKASGVKKANMRLVEFSDGFDLYSARVRVKNPMYTQGVDVAVYAKNPQMARELLKSQYGSDSIVADVRKISD